MSFIVYFHFLFRIKTENLKHFNRAMLDSDIEIHFDKVNLFLVYLANMLAQSESCIFHVWSESK